MTRKALMLHLLEQAGERGITTGELLQAGVGSRYGARLLEIREAGFVVEAVREREGSYRYRLLSAPGVERDAPRPASPGAAPLKSGRVPLSPGGRLFDLFDQDIPASVPHWKAG